MNNHKFRTLAQNIEKCKEKNELQPK